MKIHRPVARLYPITSPYGVRVDPITGKEGSTHFGIDFGVDVGTPVVASVTGRIVRAGWENPNDQKQGFGLRVWQYEAEHDAFVCYAHLSEVNVKEGDEVTAGTRIGLSGHTGKSSGPHLHNELRIGGIAGVKGSPIQYVESA